MGAELVRMLRSLRRGWVITLFVVASLAGGIAGNAASFSLLSAWIIKPMPFPEPERLVILGELEKGSPEIILNTLFSSLATWADYRDRAQTLEAFATFSAQTWSLSEGDRSVPVSVAVVTPSLFRTLGAVPDRGRLLQDAEGVVGGRRVAVIAREFWDTNLGGEGDPLGLVLTLDGDPYEVVGVVEAGFEFVVPNVRVWLPMQENPRATSRDRRTIISVARLVPGATMAQVEAEVTAIALRIEDEYPATHRGWTVDPINLRTEFPETQSRTYMALVQGAMFFVLLIACGNITNLLLARNHERRREIALRMALGAGRLRILGQLTRENMLLAVGGGVIGLALATVAIRVMNVSTSTITPSALRPTLDANVVMYTVGLTLLCGLIFGVVPGIQCLRENQMDVLRQAGSGGGHRSSGRMIRALVVGEVALCLVAIGGGSVMLQSFLAIRSRDPGYRQDGLLTVRFEIPDWKYESAVQVLDVLDRIRERTAALPRVEVAALVTSLPENILPPTDTFRIDGEPVVHGDPVPRAIYIRASPQYRETMDFPLLRGRFIEESDRAGAPLVAIVSRAMAARRFPDTTPLGRRIAVLGSPRFIVGVVGDVQHTILGKATGEMPETVYVPLAQVTRAQAYVVARTDGDPRALADPITQAISAIDPEVTVTNVETMEEFAGRFLVGIDIFNTLLAGFGVFALLLAALGTYGVVAYGVGQRTREIGIRAAIGASPRRLVMMFSREGMLMSAVGIILGAVVLVPVLYAVSGILDGFGLSPVRPSVLVGAAGLLFSVTVIASVVPASRVTRVHPASVMRSE